MIFFFRLIWLICVSVLSELSSHWQYCQTSVVFLIGLVDTISSFIKQVYSHAISTFTLSFISVLKNVHSEYCDKHRSGAFLICSFVDGWSHAYLGYLISRHYIFALAMFFICFCTLNKECAWLWWHCFVSFLECQVDSYTWIYSSGRAVCNHISFK